MIPILVEPSWIEQFPGARMGLLQATGLEPQADPAALNRARIALEGELKARFGSLDRKALRELPTFRVFEAHFRNHGKTYHVLQQLESVAVKGRSIPSRIPAVTSMFMAELRHGMVAAGHDLERLTTPLRLAASTAGETYTNLGGKPCVLPSGDMMLRDAKGILSSVLQGPEQDSPIEMLTRSALFTIYAPSGIPLAALEAQLHDLGRFLHLFSPEAALEHAIVPVG